MSAAQTRVLSIGCSCINRFQFDFFSQRHPECASAFPRSLFDWNIASLPATEQILTLARDGTLSEVLADKSAYEVAFDALIVHRDLPGFSFFHETAPKDLLADPHRFDAFLGKVQHLAKPFQIPQRDTRMHVVWSNVQPNLPDTVKNVIAWEDFQLTQARVDRIRTLCQELFGTTLRFDFLTTPADQRGDVQKDRDVTLLDLPRGDAYEGDPLLYDTVLKRALDPKP